MIDGLLVVRCAGLLSPAPAADHDPVIADLVAELRELLLRALGPAALAVIDEGWANTEALATVARTIEEAARGDAELARKITQLCDELTRRRPQDSATQSQSRLCHQCGGNNPSAESFCVHCGAFLEWEAGSTDAEPVKAPAAPSAPAPAPDDPEAATEAAPPPAEHRSFPWSRRSKTRLRLELGEATLEMAGRTPSTSGPAQATIDTALSTYVQQGRLLFDTPKHMRQGRTERVTVAIARHGGLDAQLRRLAPDSEDAPLHDVETTPFMAVDLTGSAFTIASLQLGNAAEQLLRLTALWQFDVTPERRGAHPLQLRVAMRVPLPDRPDERVSLPVLERTVHVRVDPAYSGRRFVRTHWQWLVATIAGLGGAIATWLKLFQD